ncbi:hypothetical protein LOY85_23165 [Brevibacillus brevis]|uniref:hypothetical protein n=1 Tax=Brevibacillus brevis TaxID=1393 RepID=UPI001159D099|nr:MULTISPECIES: hypothetical protein [Bacillales]TQR35555.1 hypothetical protein C7Y45_14540 [Lysinibacillus sp. SDF0063]UIO41668.1 hypothetical protein LOY85_23165 [Brevibacillus brevis]
MDEHIEYTMPLTGTLAEAVEDQDVKQLGVPFSPLSQMWQVNPDVQTNEEETADRRSNESNLPK